MTAITCQLATLLALTISPIDPPVVDYLVQVLQSLAGRSPGVHRCVFYGTQRECPFENSLGALLQDPRLDLIITRWILGGTFRVEQDEIVRNPMVMMVEGEDIGGNFENFLANVRKVRPNLKMVVLLTDLADFWHYKQYLDIMNEFEVVYVDVKGRRTIVTSMGKLEQLDYLLEPDALFNGTISSRYSLNDQPVKYSKRGMTLNSDEVWMNESASLMNTTALKMRHACPMAVDDPFDNCYWVFIIKERVDIDLSRTKFDSMFPDPNFHCMPSNIMGGDVIAVPRSALNMVQLFMMPFNWEVWITLMLILLVAEIIHLIFPQTIQNDPILMVLCGYEKQDLHQAKQPEKFLLMPLIVLMFFASCAYETKLLSMMTSKPASRNIHTFQQLIQSGIKIKSDLMIDTLLLRDSSIRDSLVNSSVDFSNLDLIHAYLLPQSRGKYLSTRYYDPAQRIHRYVLLDETYLIHSVSFFVSRRNPLREVFQYTLTCLIESGIFDVAENLDRVVDAKLLKPIFSGSEVDAAVLYFGDFEPVWIVLACGMSASLVVFAVEFTVSKVGKIKTKFG